MLHDEILVDAKMLILGLQADLGTSWGRGFLSHRLAPRAAAGNHCL